MGEVHAFLGPNGAGKTTTVLRLRAEETAGQGSACMLGAAMAQLPSALVVAGVAAAVFGLLPDVCAAVAWTALGLVVALSLFGQSLALSRWVMDISPFAHAPRLPGGPVTASPLVWLSGLAVALAALRQRDID
jgi:ABC-2 type transport system permease protein